MNEYFSKYFQVSILAGTGACGIAIMMTDIPFVQIGLLTILMSSGIGSNVLNTATVELYPTALRYVLRLFFKLWIQMKFFM